MLGNGRAECYCYDGVTRLGHIRGKMRKKVWVSAGDIVLVGKRDYQDDKASVFFFVFFYCDAALRNEVPTVVPMQTAYVCAVFSFSLFTVQQRKLWLLIPAQALEKCQRCVLVKTVCICNGLLVSETLVCFFLGPFYT